MPPNWKAAPFLAYEDPDGTRYGAVLTNERMGYVRASVFGAKWRKPTPNSAAGGPTWDSWDIDMKFRASDGARLPDDAQNGNGKPIADGRLVVSAVDLLTDFDVPNRRVKTVTLNVFEHRKLLEGGTGGQAPSGKQRVILDVEPGKVEVVSVGQTGQ